MRLLRFPNVYTYATIPVNGIGNQFDVTLPPCFGFQVLRLGPTDVGFVSCELPGVLPATSMDRSMARATEFFEAAAGQVVRLPDEHQRQTLRFTARDHLTTCWPRNPTNPSFAYRVATLCIAVLERPDCADAWIDPPDLASHRIDLPQPVIGMWSGGGIGNAAQTDHPMTATVASAPVFVGDAEGKVCFHLICTGAGGGAAAGTFYLQTTDDPTGNWKSLAWATTPLVAGVDLSEVYEATHAHGPWLRWYFVWSAGAGARTCHINCFKVRSRQH